MPTTLVISRHGHEPGHDPDGAASDDDGHQGVDDRQAHGDQRAERDREDDDREQDADHLAVAAGRVAFA